MKVDTKPCKTGFVITGAQETIWYNHYIFGYDKLVIIAHGFFASKAEYLILDFVLEVTECKSS